MGQLSQGRAHRKLENYVPRSPAGGGKAIMKKLNVFKFLFVVCACVFSCLFASACVRRYSGITNTMQGTVTEERGSYAGGLFESTSVRVNPQREDLAMVAQCQDWLREERASWDQMPPETRPTFGCYMGRLSIPAQCINLVQFRQQMPVYECGMGGGMGMVGMYGAYGYGRQGMIPATGMTPWTR